MQIIDEIDKVFASSMVKSPNNKSLNRKRIHSNTNNNRRGSIQNINIFQHFWKNMNDGEVNTSPVDLNSTSNKANKKRKFQSGKSNFYVNGNMKTNYKDRFSSPDKHQKKQKQHRNDHKLQSLNYKYHNPNSGNSGEELHRINTNYKNHEVSSIHRNTNHIADSYVSSSSSLQTVENKGQLGQISTIRKFNVLSIENITEVSDIADYITQIREKEHKKQLSLAILTQISYKPQQSATPININEKENNLIIVEEEEHNSNQVNQSNNSCHNNSNNNNNDEIKSKRSHDIQIQNQKNSKVDSNNVKAYNCSNYLIGVDKCEYSKKKKMAFLCCCFPVG